MPDHFPSLKHLYFGRAGHLFVMSEFLIRGWNVAIPEVDIGDDIFVVDDSKGQLSRIQVKSANSKPNKKGIKAIFSISTQQLFNIRAILIHYSFVARHEDHWIKPVIIRQDELIRIVQAQGLAKGKKSILISILFQEKNGEMKISLGEEDLTPFLNDFSHFPVLHHH